MRVPQALREGGVAAEDLHVTAVVGVLLAPVLGSQVDRFIKRFGDDEATRARKHDVIVKALMPTFCPEDFKDLSGVEDQLKAKYMFDEDDITYSGIIDAYDYLE